MSDESSLVTRTTVKNRDKKNACWEKMKTRNLPAPWQERSKAPPRLYKSHCRAPIATQKEGDMSIDAQMPTVAVSSQKMGTADLIMLGQLHGQVMAEAARVNRSDRDSPQATTPDMGLKSWEWEMSKQRKRRGKRGVRRGGREVEGEEKR